VERHLWTTEWFFKGGFPRFPCTRCQKGEFTYRADKIVVLETTYSRLHRQSDPDWSPPDYIEERFTILMTCNNPTCGELMIVAGDTAIDQVVDDQTGDWNWETVFRPRSVFPGPGMIKIPKEVPQPIVDEVHLAFQFYWSHLGTSATRLRTSVERVLDHFNIPAKKASGGFLTLDARIKQFEKIDQGHAETFNALRFVGNLGTHQDELTREALLDAFEVYEDALDELFSKAKHKKRIDELKKKLIAAKGQYKANPSVDSQTGATDLE
jgi:hypothetical protein